MTKAEATHAVDLIIKSLDTIRESPLAKTLTITVEEIYLHKLLGLAEGLAMSGQPELLNTLKKVATTLTIQPVTGTDKQ